MVSKKKNKSDMVLGKKEVIFYWEWGRNSAPRDGQKKPCCKCSLLCHNVSSIISREIAQTQFDQALKLQSAVVTVNITIRSMSLKSISLFSVSKHNQRAPSF